MAWDAGAAVLGDAIGGDAAASVSLSSLAPFAGPAANLAGAGIGAAASLSAANTQANAANAASQVQQNMFNTTQANLAPWLQNGTGALGQLQNLLGIGTPGGAPTQQQEVDLYNRDLLNTRGYALQPQEMNQPGVQQQLSLIGAKDFPQGSNPQAAGSFGSLLQPFSPQQYQQSPGFQFQQQQGQQQINNAAAARGTYYAPATLQSLSQFNTGLLNSDYQQALQNYTGQQQQVYNMLSGQSGSGQNAAANLGSLGAQVGQNIGSNIVGAGNAQAAGQVGAANAVSGGLTGAYNSYLTNQILGQSQQPIYGY